MLYSMFAEVASKSWGAVLALALAACLAFAAVGLSGCGGQAPLKDGTFIGQSSDFEGDAVEGAGYGIVKQKAEGVDICLFGFFAVPIKFWGYIFKFFAIGMAVISDNNCYLFT